MRPYWFVPSVAGLLWACSSDPSGAPPLVGGQAGAPAGSSGSGGAAGAPVAGEGGQGGAAIPERACEPGKVKGCQCPDGLTQSQRCAEDGSGYLACECPVDPPPMGGNAGAGGGAGEAGRGGGGIGGASGAAGAAPVCVNELDACACEIGYGSCYGGACDCTRSPKPAPPVYTCDEFKTAVPNGALILSKTTTTCPAGPRPQCHVIPPSELDSDDWSARYCADDGQKPVSIGAAKDGDDTWYVHCCKQQPDPPCKASPESECFCNIERALSNAGTESCATGALTCECATARTLPPKEAAPCSEERAVACDGDDVFPDCRVAPSGTPMWVTRNCADPLGGYTSYGVGADKRVVWCCRPSPPLLPAEG